MSDVFHAKAVTSIDEIEVPERSPRIERVPFVDTVQGVVCCNALFFLPTHYANKRGRLCLGGDDCPWHKTTKMVPYYLVAVHVTKEHKVTWYQLPPSAAKQLLFAAKVLERGIYGATVTIKRKWKAMNAPVIVSIDPGISVPNGMPQPLTPEKSIRKCFGTAGSASKSSKKAVR